MNAKIIHKIPRVFSCGMQGGVNEKYL